MPKTLDSHQRFEHSEPGHSKPLARVGGFYSGDVGVTQISLQGYGENSRTIRRVTQQRRRSLRAIDKALASRLHCECVDFPGQHDVSFYMPEEFAKAVLSTIKRWKDDR